MLNFFEWMSFGKKMGTSKLTPQSIESCHLPRTSPWCNEELSSAQCDCLCTLLMEEILHQLIGSLSHYLQGFIHLRWCRISSINRIIGANDLNAADV